MSGARKICVVTGTRAEYGLLYWLMRGIRAEPDLTLQVAVTGMHLSPEFGLTYRVIEDDSFLIDEKVEILLSSDTPQGVAKSIGLGVIGFADAFQRLSPDLLVLLGDRFEILAAAQAALVARIPIAHLCGGDTTEGAFDEAIRHSLTKMSHLHFVTNEAARRRVLQLGEDPARVFDVGSPGLDHLHRLEWLSRDELSRQLGYEFREQNLLVTFHPATLDDLPPGEQVRELLSALAALPERVGIVFTKPNADTGSRAIGQMIDAFAAARPGAVAHTSLGQLRYLSLVREVDAVVGNSSSGLCEVPSFGKPTVDIGDRQKGRLAASSVLRCACRAADILAAIEQAFTLDCSGAMNPYGDGETSSRILRILKEWPDPKSLLQKHFHDLQGRF